MASKNSAKPTAKAKAAKKPQKSAKPAAKAKPAGKPGAKAKPAPKKAAKPAPKAKPVVKKPAPKPVAKAAKPVAKVAPPAKKAPAPMAKAPAKPTPTKSAPVKAAAPAANNKPAPVYLASPHAPKPGPRPSGPKAVAVAVSRPKAPPIAKLSRKPAQPIKVMGNEVVRVNLPKGYKPSGKEAYMGPNQLEYFRQKLLNWRVELVEESKQTIDNLRDEVRDVGDEAERATRETENSLELRTRDRYRKLISKIDKALRRIEDGEYGYCEETGEEIGIERLEARPIATLSLDAQERWEHRQRQMGD
jgi:DnaK suppressor protein